MKKAQNYRETDSYSELRKKDTTHYTLKALHEIVDGGMRSHGANWEQVEYYLSLALEAVRKARETA